MIIFFMCCVTSVLSLLWYNKHTLNMLRPRQNLLRPFRRRRFQMHFLNENLWISHKISQKFVSKIRFNNIPAFGSDNGLVPTRHQAII